MFKLYKGFFKIDACVELMFMHENKSQHVQDFN